MTVPEHELYLHLRAHYRFGYLSYYGLDPREKTLVQRILCKTEEEIETSKGELIIALKGHFVVHVELK